MHAIGIPDDHQDRVHPRLHCTVCQERDEQKRQRNHELKSSLRLVKFVDLASPLKASVVGPAHLAAIGEAFTPWDAFRNLRLRRGNRTRKVAPADAELDGTVSHPVLTIYRRRTFRGLNIGDLPERY